MEAKGIVLLDYDGTVIDTMEIYASWVGKTLSRYLPLSESELRRKYLETAGRPFIEQLQIIGLPEDVSREIAKQFTEYKRELLKELDVNSCVKGFIEGLRKLGLIAVLSTNNECESVKTSPSIYAFHLVLCFDGKTHRKGIEHLSTLHRLFGEKIKIVFVGDTDYDIEVYARLGIEAIKTRGLFFCDEADRVLKIIESII